MRICPICSGQFETNIWFCPTDGVQLVAPSGEDELVGQVLRGSYRVLQRLGEGGFGKVYLAEHVKIGRRCAVKVLNRGLRGDASAISRFIREASNASHIAHPNVAAIYDFGETSDGLLYIAMEYVEGETLSRIVQREGALAVAEAVEIARQMAEALGAAHELGIVHRDLKPDNVIVRYSKEGTYRLKLVDFGISKSTQGGQEGLTRTGFAIGTPDYMSPEQLTDDPVDARSDIYSLGCILYQLLVGEQPFTGPSLESQITRRLLEDPPRPRSRNPKIPRALDDAVAKALAKAPDRRFQTAEELCAALHAAMMPSRSVLQLSSWNWMRRSTPATAIARDAMEPSRGGSLPATPSTESPSLPSGERARPATLRERMFPRTPARWKWVVGGGIIVGLGVVAVVLTSGERLDEERPASTMTDVQPDSSLIDPTIPEFESDQPSDNGSSVGLNTDQSRTSSGRTSRPQINSQGDAKETDVQDPAAASTRPGAEGNQGHEVSQTPPPPPLQPGQSDPVAEESTQGDTGPPATLAEVRQLIPLAKVEQNRGEFVAAITRLRGAETRLLNIQGSAAAALLEEVRDSVLSVQRACAGLGAILRLRGETPPPCG